MEDILHISNTLRERLNSLSYKLHGSEEEFLGFPKINTFKLIPKMLHLTYDAVDLYFRILNNMGSSGTLPNSWGASNNLSPELIAKLDTSGLPFVVVEEGNTASRPHFLLSNAIKYTLLRIKDTDELFMAYSINKSGAKEKGEYTDTYIGYVVYPESMPRIEVSPDDGSYQKFIFTGDSSSILHEYTRIIRGRGMKIREWISELPFEVKYLGKGVYVNPNGHIRLEIELIPG